MNRTAATLNELVANLIDGIDFYAHAARQAGDDGLRDLFRQMGEMKAAIAADLRKEITYQGAVADEHGSWTLGMREGYAALKGRLTDDPDAAWIASLEEQEDRILHEFRAAAAADQPARVRELAARYLPQLQQSHDRLRDLKRSARH